MPIPAFITDLPDEIRKACKSPAQVTVPEARGPGWVYIIISKMLGGRVVHVGKTDRLIRRLSAHQGSSRNAAKRRCRVAGKLKLSPVEYASDAEEFLLQPGPYTQQAPEGTRCQRQAKLEHALRRALQPFRSSTKEGIHESELLGIYRTFAK